MSDLLSDPNAAMADIKAAIEALKSAVTVLKVGIHKLSPHYPGNFLGFIMVDPALWMYPNDDSRDLKGCQYTVAMDPL